MICVMKTLFCLFFWLREKPFVLILISYVLFIFIYISHSMHNVFIVQVC